MVDRPDRTMAAPGPAGGAGLCKRVVVSVTMAGAVAGGGGSVAAIGFFRPEVTYMLLGLVPLLFVLGTVLGLMHGAGLAWIGRPPDLPRGAYRAQLGRGLLWCIPGFIVASVITFWVAYTTALLAGGRLGWVVAVILGWIAAVGVFFWAGAEAVRAARNVIRRWPQWRAGLVLISATFVALFLALPRVHFELRGVGLEVSTLGSALGALLLTVWIAAPIEVRVLRRFRRREADRGDFREFEAGPRRASLKEAK